MYVKRHTGRALALLVAAGAWGCAEDPPIQSADDALEAAADADATIAINPVVPVFLPEGGTAATGAVSVDGSVEGGKIRVVVAINHFSDLFGIAAHLHYDPTVLQLSALQAEAVPLGDKHDTSDYTPRSVAKESPAGRILLGGARFSNVPSPFDTPTGVKLTRETWLTLEFQVLKQVKTSVSFDPATRVVRNGAYTEIPADWGSLTIDWPAQGGAP